MSMQWPNLHHGTMQHDAVFISEAVLLRGSDRQTVACAFTPCAYPRDSCNTGYQPKSVDGKMRCVATNPPPQDSVQPADCCPSGGVWGLWSAWSACTTKCGSCSQVTRTRKCASTRYGCPCANNATVVGQKKYCNRTPCTYPEDSCCTPFTVKSTSAGLQCF
ncbi:Protein Y8A9A.2 [Aphelenchoides avenae]|nr:Protein Y8A9A.2 [Aphelenchus avenae]